MWEYAIREYVQEWGEQTEDRSMSAFLAELNRLGEDGWEAVGITPQPDSLEQDVKAVLTKVGLGEVDAGLVYKTDVLSAKDKVDGIEFPEADKAINEYPIATLTKAPNPDGAKAFVDYVLSDQGKAVMTAAGFSAP